MALVVALLSAVVIGICSRMAWEYSAADGIVVNLMALVIGIVLLAWEPHTAAVLVANTTVLSWIGFEKYWIDRKHRKWLKALEDKVSRSSKPEP